MQRTFGPKLRHFLAGALRSRLNALVAEKEAFRDIEIEAVARSTGTRSAT